MAPKSFSQDGAGGFGGVGYASPNAPTNQTGTPSSTVPTPIQEPSSMGSSPTVAGQSMPTAMSQSQLAQEESSALSQQSGLAPPSNTSIGNGVACPSQPTSVGSAELALGTEGGLDGNMPLGFDQGGAVPDP